MATYDSQKVTAFTPSLSQLGYSVNTTTEWFEDSIARYGAFIDGGTSFDFGVSSNSETGLILAPQLPFTNVTTDPLGTGETSTYWTLTFETTRTSILPTDVFLYGVIFPRPDIWSGKTNSPTINHATTNESYLIETVSQTDTNWVLNGSTYNLVFQLDFSADSPESQTGRTVLSPLKAIVTDSKWNGILQFFLRSPNSTNVVISTATFTGSVHDWHTGMIGVQMDVRGRAVHDHITGQPYMSHIAVSDGYRDGIMVHPDNFDPADPLEENPWTPPPGEGAVDDEIVDVE